MAICRVRACPWLAAGLAAFLTAGGAASASPLAFSTEGGEAWTFHKRLELLVTEGACDEVALASPVAHLVQRPQAGRVIASLALRAGDNTVIAECRKDGARRGEPLSQHWLVRLRDAPTARVKVHVGEAGFTLDGTPSEPAGSLPTPIRSFAWRVQPGNPGPLLVPAEGARIEVPTPVADGEYCVSLTVADETGRTDRAAVMFRVRDGEASLVGGPGDGDVPAWIDQAVVYGVMAPAFAPPRLAAVAARLDALKAVGIDTLWLSPVTASAPGDFGYAVTDHFSLRPDLGSEADLRALVDAAHARGMRLLLDFVANHLSDQHPYYSSVSRLDHASPYYDFFARAPSGEVAHYFDWSNLENLNYANPEVQQMMIEAFAHWVRALDIDGFRVDAAWGPRERAPEFWPRLIRELRRIKPDLLLLAEAPSRDGYYQRSGFDAAYDWTDRLGVWSWARAFDGEADAASRLQQTLASADSRGIRVFRFLNNNDTGARFVTRHGVGMTRVAAAMLLTLPGIPGLYTGDEVGAEFEPYKQHAAIRWDDVHGLRAWYAGLLRLRHSLPALRSRGMRVLDLAGARQVLAYLRPGTKPRDGVLVLLNYGAEPAEVALPESVVADLAPAGTLQDLLDEAEPVGRDHRTIGLAGYGVRILQAR